MKRNGITTVLCVKGRGCRIFKEILWCYSNLLYTILSPLGFQWMWKIFLFWKWFNIIIIRESGGKWAQAKMQNANIAFQLKGIYFWSILTYHLRWVPDTIFFNFLLPWCPYHIVYCMTSLCQHYLLYKSLYIIIYGKNDWYWFQWCVDVAGVNIGFR